MLRSDDRLLNRAAQTAVGTFRVQSGNGPNDATDTYRRSGVRERAIILFFRKCSQLIENT
jgi:hypothetical protein